MNKVATKKQALWKTWLRAIAISLSIFFAAFQIGAFNSLALELYLQLALNNAEWSNIFKFYRIKIDIY